MKGYNKVMLIGRLAADPELRQTTTGRSVASFALAVHRQSVKEPNNADFHQVVAWSKLADFCSRILKKGMTVFITGKLVKHSYEGKNGKQFATEVILQDVNILTWKGRESVVEDPADDDIEEVEVSGDELSATILA